MVIPEHPPQAHAEHCFLLSGLNVTFIDITIICIYIVALLPKKVTNCVLFFHPGWVCLFDFYFLKSCIFSKCKGPFTPKVKLNL